MNSNILYIIFIFLVDHQNLTFFTKSTISVIVDNVFCTNLPTKLPVVNFLNSSLVTYLP